jgi:uncharacterized membrane protein
VANQTRWALVITLAATVMLLGGFAHKNVCATTPWQNQFQYKALCYSDIMALYWVRGLHNDTVPYAEALNEYPVLTGAVQYLTAALSDGARSFWLLNAFLLLIAGFATVVAVAKTAPDPRRALAFAASPALLIHGMTNWDLIAVAFAAWGWWQWRDGWPFGAALLFGLGGAAKLYPAFFLPFIGLWCLSRRDFKALKAAVAGGTLGFVVPNAVVYHFAPQGWLDIWRFHNDRGIDFESAWAVAGLESTPNVHLVSLATLGIMVAALAILGALIWRQRMGPLEAGGLLVLLFLLANRVYSPQYTLWALPILVVMGARWLPLLGYLAADLGVFVARYGLFTTPEGAPENSYDEAWRPLHVSFVGLRWVFLAWATWALARKAAGGRAFNDGGGPTSQPPPTPQSSL